MQSTDVKDALTALPEELLFADSLSLPVPPAGPMQLSITLVELKPSKTPYRYTVRARRPGRKATQEGDSQLRGICISGKPTKDSGPQEGGTLYVSSTTVAPADCHFSIAREIAHPLLATCWTMGPPKGLGMRGRIGDYFGREVGMESGT